MWNDYGNLMMNHWSSWEHPFSFGAQGWSQCQAHGSSGMWPSCRQMAMEVPVRQMLPPRRWWRQLLSIRRVCNTELSRSLLFFFFSFFCTSITVTNLFCHVNYWVQWTSGERPPWWKTRQMRDHPDERPSWWETILKKDQTYETTLMTDQADGDPADKSPHWWKTKQKETTLMRDQANGRPSWWETTLMRVHPDGRLSWWETTLKRDQADERTP